MSEFVIYHNPKCSTCRKALALIADKDPKVIEYLETPMTKLEILELASKIQLRPKDFIRVKEDEFKAAQESLDLEDDEAVAQLMSVHPKLMQRPIVLRGDRGVLGRPTENILELL